MNAEFARERGEAAFERPDDAGRDSRRMPIHAHHGAEGLKPERMSEPPQKFVAPVMVHDGFAQHGAKPGHPPGQPGRNTTAVQRKIGAPGASRARCHSRLLLARCGGTAGAPSAPLGP